MSFAVAPGFRSAQSGQLRLAQPARFRAPPPRMRGRKKDLRRVGGQRVDNAVDDFLDQ